LSDPRNTCSRRPAVGSWSLRRSCSKDKRADAGLSLSWSPSPKQLAEPRGERASARGVPPTGPLSDRADAASICRHGAPRPLEWRDVDLTARRLTVQRSDWLGHVTVPKGGRSRQLPMTQRLTAALKAGRHLRSDRVLCLTDGSAMTRDRVIKAVRGAQRLAGIEQGVHILRHTFCSHLAMKGRLHGPSRSSRDTRTYRRRSATCT
jgi:integrase